MRRFFILIFFFTFSALTVIGQITRDEFIQYRFPDIVKFLRPKSDTIKSLEYLQFYLGKSLSRAPGKLNGEFIYKGQKAFLFDSLTNPTRYLFESERGILFIALKEKNYYLVYRINDELYSRAQLINFNDTGNDELLLYWYSDPWRWNHVEGDTSISDTASDAEIESQEYYVNFCIFDLDKIESIGCFWNVYCYERFVMGFRNDYVEEDYEPDGGNHRVHPVPLAAINKGFHNFVESIKPKEITFTETGKCDCSGDTFEKEITNPVTLKYVLTSVGLVRTK